MERAYQIIKRPLLTEKSTREQEGKIPVPHVNRGREQKAAYHFAVAKWANKIEIRHAVEVLFDVKVEKVNTVTKRGKATRRGWVIGKAMPWKKAVVTLEPGQRIDFV